MNPTGASHPERLEFVVSHPNYFSMLGATPQIGRLFGPQDFALGFAPTAVISDGLWRRSYGADPDVLGHAFTSTTIPTPSSVFFRRISPSWTNRFRECGSISNRRIQRRSRSDASAGYAFYARGNWASQARNNVGAGAGARSPAMANQLRHDFPTVVRRNPNGRLKLNHCRKVW